MKHRAVGAAVLMLLAACSSSGTATSPRSESSDVASAGQTSTTSPLSESLVTDGEPPADEANQDADAGESTTATTGSVSETGDADADVDAESVQPERFTTATVEITKADGTVCEVCMWLADSPEERGRGLMGVTDLGTADGMAFVFDQPTNGAFFMFQTVTPLSIAWFAPDGGLVSTADMNPCESADASQCERFPAGGQFELAIEVFQGDLESIGITDGATARVIADTESDTCPEA